MARRALPMVVAVLLAQSWTAPAAAHGIGALYNLPVPLWLYAWGSAAVLLLSFVVAALLWRSPGGDLPAEREIDGTAFAQLLRRLRTPLRLLSVALLLLMIATGALGARDPLRNFSTVFFWIGCVLVVPYLTALLGDFYAAINPWRAICDAIGRLWPGLFRGRWAWPAWLSSWPAVMLFIGFIGFELFGTGRPLPLALFLGLYTALNLAAAWAFGARAWFARGEFFGVMLHLIGHMGVLRWQPGEQGQRGRLLLRAPLAGILIARPRELATVAFLLAMLATTAYDGLRATQWWVLLFWNDPTGLLREHFGAHPFQLIAELKPYFRAWEWFWLVAMPLLYVGAYLSALWLARVLTGSRRSLRELALDFALPLLPIALVYHFTHYFTLVLSHGLKILSVVSDPFGWRWDLLGTADRFRAPILPDMGLVWHSQVGLIVAGHVAGVWLSHRIALRLFASPGRALASQLPMLALMVAFTVFGLWILAQPLTVQLIR